MKIPIWIKSEYVTYIGIALLSFVRRGKPPFYGGQAAFYVFCFPINSLYIANICSSIFFLSYYVHQRLDRPPQ